MRSLEFNGHDLSHETLRDLCAEPDIEHLTIWSGPFSSDDLAPLANLTSLKGLVLGELALDEDFLRHLRPLISLEYLNLAYTTIRGDFSPLAALPLRDIRLEGCRFVGDDTLRSLAKTPTLCQIEVHMTGVTDSGVEALSSLPLEVVWLGPRVTDAAMRTLATIPTLRHLDICAHNVSDEGAAALATLPNLEILWLTRCQITDAVIPRLQCLGTLQELNVNHTGITPTGLARLRSALPGCRFPEPD